MANKRMYEIDKAKLRKELAERDLTFGDASEGMGFDRTYLQKFNKINKRAMLLLKVMYGIEEEDIILKDEPEEPKVEEVKQEQTVFDYDKLYEVIYNATYTAVKRAWMDD